MSHIFEPFFTTKQLGKGTGLGLATVYGTVTQSGGFICVHSEPGQGTTFKIYFPYLDEENALEVVAKKATILVIEDDETSRIATVKSLEEDGYRVLPAADATEALAVCQQWSEPIHVVLIDVLSSGISQEDLIGYFGVKYPNLAVVDMSGFARSEVKPQTFVAHALFLAKPFTPAQLRDTIERALRPDQAGSADAPTG